MTKKRKLWTLLCLFLFALFGPYLWSRIASSYRCVRIRSIADSDTTPPATNRSSHHGNHIRIACYNIAHGRGLAESNWTSESIGQRNQRLDDIANLLLDMDADVVVTEVELVSRE